MSGTMKLVIAALIAAGVIAGAGAVYVLVIAPPAVQNAIIPGGNGNSATNAQLDAAQKAQCQATVQELGAANITPLCRQILSGKTSN